MSLHFSLPKNLNPAFPHFLSLSLDFFKGKEEREGGGAPHRTQAMHDKLSTKAQAKRNSTTQLIPISCSVSSKPTPPPSGLGRSDSRINVLCVWWGWGRGYVYACE